MMRTIRLFAFAIVAVLLVAYIRTEYPYYTSIEFNPYALIPAFTVVVNLLLIAAINRPRYKSLVTSWFTVFMAFLTVWSFTEMMRRLTTDISIYQFWTFWGSLGWATMPVGFLIFTYVYIGKEKLIVKPSVLANLLIVPPFIMVAVFNTALIIPQDLAQYAVYPWGFAQRNGPLFAITLLWMEVLIAAGMYNLIKYMRRSKNMLIKRQSRLFIISALIPIIGGTITDGILPIIGIRVLPTANLLISVMGLMIFYAIRRYGLFAASPAAYSDTILETMEEAVFGLDGNFNIQYINSGAEKLVGYQQADLLGTSIASVFSNQVFSDMYPRIAAGLNNQKETYRIRETEIVNRAHNIIPVSLTITAVFATDGRIAGYVMVLANIATEKSLVLDLRQERDTVESIIGSMAECLVAVDVDRKITKVNHEAERQLNINAKEFLGKTFTEIVEVRKDGKPLEKEQYLLYRTMNEGKSIIVGVEDDYELKTRSGVVFPFAAHTAPIILDGRVTGAMIVFRNIATEKKAAQTIQRRVVEQTRTIWEEEAKLDASIQSLELGFVMLSRKGEILRVNGYAGNLLGPENLTEGIKSISKLVPIKLLEKFEKSLESRKPLEIPNVPLGPKILNFVITPIIMNNEAIGGVVLIDDVTEEKMLQRSKDEFFSIASHELRTPLTAIRGNTSMIKQYFAPVLKKNNIETMIDDIHESSVRLIEIVNDFLDVSRLEQGKMTFDLEAFKVHEIITGVINETAATAAEKKTKVSMKPDVKKQPPVYADQNKVKQIIYNLVGNALKFTESGTVTIGAHEDNGHLRITVTDAGRGIPMDKQAALFHKFQQAGESLLTRDTVRGTGLGLYISRLLASNMGGEAGLEWSEEGKGSTFYFTLPISKDSSKTKSRTKQKRSK